MAKNNFIYNSFIAGEISPKFLGRVNTPIYNDACENLRNMIISPQGGAVLRPGTLTKSRITRSDGIGIPGRVRNFSFRGTDGTRWQIIITDEDPTSALQSVSGSMRSPWRAYNITTGQYQNVTMYNNSPLYVPFHGGPDVNDANRTGEFDFSATGKNIDLGVIQSAQSGDTMVIVGGGFRILTLVYDTTRGYDSQFFLYGFPSFYSTPQEILGNGITSRGFQMPMIDPAINTTTLTLNVNTGTGAYYLTSALITDSSWEGRWFKLQGGGVSGSVLIYGKTYNAGTGHLDCVYIRGSVLVTGTYPYGAATAGTSWTQGEWNDTFGWPRTVGFFDSRLVFGGNTLFPDKQWFSEINNVFAFDAIGLDTDAGFTDPVVASDAFALTLKENEYSEIRWMTPKQTLTTGTDSGEFIVQGPDQSSSIGPTNSGSNIQTPYGSAPVSAIGYDNCVMFLVRDRRSIREMVYNLAQQSFVAPDISIQAEHMANKGALERAFAGYGYAVNPGAYIMMARQTTPTGIVWLLDNNGFLIGVTRDRQQEIIAFHSHEIVGPGVPVANSVGVLDAFDYKPKIESIATIQKTPIDSIGTGGEPDELWMIVSRGYKGFDIQNFLPANKQFFLEKMAQEWDRGPIGNGWDDTIDVAPVYCDGAIIFNSADNPECEAEGLIPVPHLTIGQIVSVVMNGFDLGEFTVNDNFEIDISANLTESMLEGDTVWQAVVGFTYIGQLNPVVPEVPAQIGSSQGQPRRIDQISIKFLNSLGVRFGRVTSTEEDNTPVSPLEDIIFPIQTDFSIPQALYSGMKKLDFPQGYEQRPQLLIETYRPLPCIVTHIVARMVVYEQ